jgi:predicted AlkP superfamily phosphohydrolase/phosphomutase
VGSIGHGTILTFDNDIGPDDANHAPEGICIIHDPLNAAQPPASFRQDLDILDIAPTVLHVMGVPVPKGMRGKILTNHN